MSPRCTRVCVCFRCCGAASATAGNWYCYRCADDGGRSVRLSAAAAAAVRFFVSHLLLLTPLSAHHPPPHTHTQTPPASCGVAFCNAVLYSVSAASVLFVLFPVSHLGIAFHLLSITITCRWSRLASSLDRFLFLDISLIQREREREEPQQDARPEPPPPVQSVLRNDVVFLTVSVTLTPLPLRPSPAVRPLCTARLPPSATTRRLWCPTSHRIGVPVFLSIKIEASSEALFRCFFASVPRDASFVAPSPVASLLHLCASFPCVCRLIHGVHWFTCVRLLTY